MYDFNRCNKQAGVYWLQNTVDDLQIRIKLQPQDSIKLLPKLEDYISNPTPSLLDTPPLQEYTFKWQEKVFSKWEISRYTDVHNCLTEAELKYHEILANNEYESSNVFTYVNQDCHVPTPWGKIKKSNGVEDLSSCFRKLGLNEGIDKVGFGSESMSHLFRSEENLVENEEQWTAMHVVFDKSDYNEDSQLLLKQEAPLLSVYHNTSLNYLMLIPDINDLELNPYCVEPMAGVHWGYRYAVEVDFGEENGAELVEFLKKLQAKWESKHSQLINFISPEFDKKQTIVSFEILTASGFDNDSSYIEFTIKIPEGIKCEGPLHGRTHKSKASSSHSDETWHFSHVLDLQLEMDSDLDPKPIIIYLEMISTDWWGRHRTEGYTCLTLFLDPGHFTRKLYCMRPEEDIKIKAEERRFFIGGCNLIKELDVLNEPQSYDTNFKFTTTGTIKVRWNTLTQSFIAGLHSSTPEPRSSSSSDVLRGAEAVLRKYKMARARLEAVTKDLRNMPGDGSGDG